MKFKQKIFLKIYIVCILIVLISSSYMIYWCIFYHPFLSYKKDWFLPPSMRSNTMLADLYGNAVIADFNNNMLIILSVSNKHKKDSMITWLNISLSTTHAKSYSSNGYVVDIYKKRDKFIIIDGCTGKELMLLPLINNNMHALLDKLVEGDLDEKYNILKKSCQFLGISDEEYLKIQDIIESHNISKKNLGSITNETVPNKNTGEQNTFQ